MERRSNFPMINILRTNQVRVPAIACAAAYAAACIRIRYRILNARESERSRERAREVKIVLNKRVLNAK